MPQSLKTYEFGGKVVYSPNGKTQIGKVDYLRYDDLGREILKWIRIKFRGNECIKTDPADAQSRGEPIWEGTILLEGAVSSALDSLGITNIHTATPEQVMGVMRSQNFEDVKKTENYFGVVITGNRADPEKDRYLYANVPYANHLVEQAGIPEEMLPVAMFQLRSVPDSSYETGVRLDFVEGKSIWLPAPAFRIKTNEVPEYFTSDKTRSIEQILGDNGEILYIAVENIIRVCKPLRHWGLSALVRKGNNELDTNDYLRRKFIDMEGRVLLGFKK